MATPSQLAPLAMPAIRKSNGGSCCSHRHMTRLYDQYGAQICLSCFKHPDFGWLYRCTQDTDGFLPQADFEDVEQSTAKKDPQNDCRLYNLNKSLVKGILNEEYTPNQVATLVKQKEEVRAAVLGSVTRPTTSSSNSSGRTSVFTEHLPESSTFSTNPSVQLDEELRIAYDWAELQKAWETERPATASSKTVNDSPSAIATPKPLQPRKFVPQATNPEEACQHLICASCKPILRDRAFGSIDEVVNNPQIPPVWELNNRPVSDARILREIGLPKHPRFYAQFSPSETDPRAEDRSSTESLSIPSLNLTDEIQHHEDESANQIRNMEGLQTGNSNRGGNGSRLSLSSFFKRHFRHSREESRDQ